MSDVDGGGGVNTVMQLIRAGRADLNYDVNSDGKLDIADARFIVVHFTNVSGVPCR